MADEGMESTLRVAKELTLAAVEKLSPTQLGADPETVAEKVGEMYKVVWQKVKESRQ